VTHTAFCNDSNINVSGFNIIIYSFPSGYLRLHFYFFVLHLIRSIPQQPITTTSDHLSSLFQTKTMPQDFTNRVIAVSGAASGIGLATAKYLYSIGASLSITDIRQGALDAAVSQITDSAETTDQSALTAKLGLLQNTEEILSAKTSGHVSKESERILAVVTDVRSSEQVNTWIDLTVKKFGRLDACANLAGVVGRGIGTSPITAMSDEDWSFVIDINLTAVFYAMRAQIKVMKHGGSIVNVASTAGIQGNACNAEYSASKHGVVGLTRSAAKEVGGLGIRVNAIAP
jgi:NAD(P)-dependent dehydrogenase (short-subunit alcohol dehydrogenase family)